MSGYKRVNFYELCRLCASNQQKEKTHIFHEEGRKIQLQNKIQSLLKLKVCENDYLPKVVCSKCLECLEECYTFRNECITSEGMLSSYFNNYRYKEDFTKNGKVYIKDTQPKSEEERPKQPETAKPRIAPQETVTINPNGEIVNISTLVDLEGILGKKKQQPKKKEETIKQIKAVYPVKLESSPINQNVIVNPVVRSLPNYTTKILESAQKIVENFSNLNPPQQTCYYTNYPAEEVKPNIEQPLNTISPNWTENITIPNQNRGKVKLEPLKSFECVVCKKTFKRKEHLYQHVKLHTGFRPFTCENCNKSFMRKEHLLRHMMSHSGLKNFTCTICDKSFSRNDNLLKHKKTHEKESNFTCEICHKQFVMKHYYLAHKVTHDGENKTIAWGDGVKA